MPTSAELRAEADKVKKQSEELYEAAMAAHREELLAKTLADRMIFAAFNRCPCGAGLAYDPAFEDQGSVFKGPLSGHWDCSEIMLGTADGTARHTDKLPFAFYEFKSEQQPSANGATTRQRIK